MDFVWYANCFNGNCMSTLNTSESWWCYSARHSYFSIAWNIVGHTHTLTNTLRIYIHIPIRITICNWMEFMWNAFRKICAFNYLGNLRVTSCELRVYVERGKIPESEWLGIHFASKFISEVENYNNNKSHKMCMCVFVSSSERANHRIQKHKIWMWVIRNTFGEMRQSRERERGERRSEKERCTSCEKYYIHSLEPKQTDKFYDIFSAKNFISFCTWKMPEWMLKTVGQQWNHPSHYMLAWCRGRCCCCCCRLLLCGALCAIVCAWIWAARQSYYHHQNAKWSKW